MKGNQIRFSPNFLAIPSCFTTTYCTAYLGCFPPIVGILSFLDLSMAVGILDEPGFSKNISINLKF